MGICLGLQLMVIEFARHICNLKNANSTEFDPQTPYPVIDFIPEQKGLKQKGWTMRLGAYPAYLKDNTKVKSIYKKDIVWERHRHRYEVNPDYVEILQENWLIVSWVSEDAVLTEFIEIKNHPFYIWTQAHPEFKSRPLDPQPLFVKLIEVAKELNHW